MRIGINARYLAEPMTGLGQFSIHLCRALLEFAPQHQYIFYCQKGRKIVSPGEGDFRTIEIPIENRNHFDLHFTEDPAFGKVIPDILHLTHLNMPINSQSIPTLLTIHDVIPVAFMRPGMILWGKTPFRSLTSIGIAAQFTDPTRIRRANLITTVSAVSAKDIRRIYRYKNEIPVVPPGMDNDILAPPSKDVIRETLEKYDIHRPYLINFGGLAVRKNIKRQIRAFCNIRQDFPDLHFVIIGEGFWYKKLAHKNIPGVRFSGPLPREDLQTLLHGALFSTYMSLYEGFGLPALEAAGCGIPVMASAGTSMDEILPGHLLLTNPYSVRAITTAMREMLENREQWKKTTLAAKIKLEEYSWKNVALRYLELYKGVRENHHG